MAFGSARSWNFPPSFKVWIFLRSPMLPFRFRNSPLQTCASPANFLFPLETLLWKKIKLQQLNYQVVEILTSRTHSSGRTVLLLPTSVSCLIFGLKTIGSTYTLWVSTKWTSYGQSIPSYTETGGMQPYEKLNQTQYVLSKHIHIYIYKNVYLRAYIYKHV